MERRTMIDFLDLENIKQMRDKIESFIKGNVFCNKQEYEFYCQLNFISVDNMKIISNNRYN